MVSILLQSIATFSDNTRDDIYTNCCLPQDKFSESNKYGSCGTCKEETTNPMQCNFRRVYDRNDI